MPLSKQGFHDAIMTAPEGKIERDLAEYVEEFKEELICGKPYPDWNKFYRECFNNGRFDLVLPTNDILKAVSGQADFLYRFCSSAACGLILNVDLEPTERRWSDSKFLQEKQDEKTARLLQLVSWVIQNARGTAFPEQLLSHFGMSNQLHADIYRDMVFTLIDATGRPDCLDKWIKLREDWLAEAKKTPDSYEDNGTDIATIVRDGRLNWAKRDLQFFQELKDEYKRRPIKPKINKPPNSFQP